MVEKNKIGLITTVSNWELYEKTKQYFPSGIKTFVIDGTTGMYGLKSLIFSLDKLKKHKIDWLIMADEDVVFTDPDKVFDLIDFLSLNKFTASGMRDGGTLNFRNKNPYVINHFFAVLNLADIYKYYNKKEILKNNYVKNNEFSTNIPDLNFSNYDVNSLAEKYYCFYFWLLRKKKKFLYLDGSTPIENDFATTLLKDHLGNPFLYHTWYARFYQITDYHTCRINKILDKAEKDNLNEANSFILLKKPFYDIKFWFYKYYRRILRSIS